jgi:hypothetical protein
VGVKRLLTDALETTRKLFMHNIAQSRRIMLPYLNFIDYSLSLVGVMAQAILFRGVLEAITPTSDNE